MSNFLITRNGALRSLYALTNTLAGTVVTDKCGLFINDIEPSFDSLLADLMECTYAGYANAIITWPAAIDVWGSDFQGIVANPITFTFSAYVGAPRLVYGAFIEDDSPELTFVRRFSNPYVVPNAGGTLVVTPTIRQRNV